MNYTILITWNEGDDVSSYSFYNLDIAKEAYNHAVSYGAYYVELIEASTGDVIVFKA